MPSGCPRHSLGLMPSEFAPAWLGKTPSPRQMKARDFVPGTTLPRRGPSVKDLLTAAHGEAPVVKVRKGGARRSSKQAAQRVDASDVAARSASPDAIRFSPMGTPLSLLEAKDLGNVDTLGMGVRSGQRSASASPNKQLYDTKPGMRGPSSSERRNRLMVVRRAAANAAVATVNLQPWEKPQLGWAPRAARSPPRRRSTQRELSPSQLASQRNGGRRTRRKAPTPSPAQLSPQGQTSRTRWAMRQEQIGRSARQHIADPLEA